MSEHNLVKAPTAGKGNDAPTMADFVVQRDALRETERYLLRVLNRELKAVLDGKTASLADAHRAHCALDIVSWLASMSVKDMRQMRRRRAGA